MLTDAFFALGTFDWGQELSVLRLIDDAAVAAEGNPELRQDLENRLLAALKGRLSRDAHDYVCRKLTLVGSAAAVPTLAGLLGNKATAHMARYALERITAPQAGQALREAIASLNGDLKIGVISSLGSRRDRAAVVPLGGLLQDENPAVVRAAALALGTIGTAESAAVLQAALQSGTGEKQAVIDGLLSSAEVLLASGKEADAHSIYKSLRANQPGRLVHLAATRGLLACGSKRA